MCKGFMKTISDQKFIRHHRLIEKLVTELLNMKYVKISVKTIDDLMGLY